MPRSLALLAALVLGLAACAPPASPTAGATAASAHAASARPAPADTVRPDWADAFRQRGAVGTFVLFDTRTGRTSRMAPERAARRFPPASTFKVYNALVALETGVAGDPDSVFVWDGVERSIPAWNRDHTLRSGMTASTVWLYQRVAEAVGREGYEAAFAREPYGNGLVGDTVTTFWLGQPLAISADEQIAFVDRLRRDDLAFRPDVQAAVRDLLPVLAEGDGWRILAKTGWTSLPDGTDIGWIVGWVERPEGDVVFALNAEPAPGATFDIGPGRLAIAREILAGEGLLPER